MDCISDKAGEASGSCEEMKAEALLSLSLSLSQPLSLSLFRGGRLAVRQLEPWGWGPHRASAPQTHVGLLLGTIGAAILMKPVSKETRAECTALIDSLITEQKPNILRNTPMWSLLHTPPHTHPPPTQYFLAIPCLAFSKYNRKIKGYIPSRELTWGKTRSILGKY